MSFLLPSDMGRLIYGYLLTSCNEELAEQFLNTSDAMKECREHRHVGFNAEVHDRTLIQMLNEYSLLSDFIFEHFSEHERSHFNIVNTLQNLLKSKGSFSKKSVPIDAGSPGVSRRSENTSEETSESPISRVLSNTLREISRKNDLAHNSLPFSTCSDSSPLSQSIIGSRSSAVTSTLESMIVNNVISENSVSDMSVLNSINEERVPATSNLNTVISTESASQFRNTPIFGIAKSTSSGKVSSPKKPAKKLEKTGRNSSLRIRTPVKEPARLTKSASSSSPLQNLACNDMELDDTNMFLNTVPDIPDISVKSKPSDQFRTPTKEFGRDRSSEKQDIGLKDINSVRLIDSLAEKTPEKSSPNRHKSPKIKGSDDVREKSLSKSKPIKILPKLSSAKLQLPKNNSPINKKKQSILARPTCTEPWDYSLRQGIIDEAESVKSSDNILKKECKKDKQKKDRPVDGENSKAESSKRKLDKKPIVCKKKKKLEEAKARAEAKEKVIKEKGHDKPKKVDPLSTSHSGSIDPVKQNATRVAEKPKSLKTSQPDNIMSDSPKTDVNTNDCEEEDPLLRRQISEEIVLYCKVSTDVSVLS